ncbi:hypothetical protein H6788_00215 [Candidatus Nomurabacteria bacterium]|nr:hypothetical protein [Candidatus Nomurabacteria bacterium]MCB9819230.1 hypothetical protein [Candidatus Nomurabacteria bacterium]
MKILVVILGLIFTILVIIWGVVTFGTLEISTTDNRDDGASINVESIRSFEDCLVAGLPVMESYPRQCRTPDGRTFAEEIVVYPNYFNSNPDMIVVENPHPGGVVGKEFVVTGEARGNWFFEASFPIEVIGADGNVIAGSFATAEGDWMTTEFVSFKSEMIDLPSAYIGPATLVLKKDNPSGLPENDASLSIPIVVEY